MDVQMGELPGEVATKHPFPFGVNTEKDAVTRLDGIQKIFKVARQPRLSGFQRPEKCHRFKRRNICSSGFGKPAAEKHRRQHEIKNAKESRGGGGKPDEFSEHPGFIQRSGAGFC